MIPHYTLSSNFFFFHWFDLDTKFCTVNFAFYLKYIQYKLWLLQFFFSMLERQLPSLNVAFAETWETLTPKVSPHTSPLPTGARWKEAKQKVKAWHYCFILDGGVLQLWRAFAIVLACWAVRLFVKYVHQLESVAIRQTWCERIRESICWHSGQRYVINADFTLHWIELAMIATSPPLIHPIKPSLFIYLQPQPPDMHGMSAPAAPQTHAPAKVNCAHIFPSISSEAVKDTHRYLKRAVSWLKLFFSFWTKILPFCSTHMPTHLDTHSVSVYSTAVRWQGA